MSTSTNKTGGRNGRKRRNKKLTFQEKKMEKIAFSAIKKNDAREVERKYKDLINPSQVVGSTGYLTSLTSTISVGPAFDQRIGMDIKVTSLQLRYTVTFNDPINFMRVILFRWFDDDVPTISDVLESNVPYSALAINTLTGKKMQVLHTNLIALSEGSVPNTVQEEYFSGNYHCSWDKTINPDHGHFYLYAITDSSVSGPNLKFYSRVRFTDQ